MAAGKNKIETGFTINFDDVGGTARDLTGDLVPGSIGPAGFAFDTADMTGVGNTVKNFYSTWASSEISAQFHVNDTASTGSSVVFNGYTPALINTGGTLTLAWGDAGAAPTTGDIEWEGEYIVSNATISFASGTAVIDVTWQVQPGTTAPAWGTAS